MVPEFLLLPFSQELRVGVACGGCEGPMLAASKGLSASVPFELR